MRLTFRQLEAEQALAILNWRYNSPYDYYNFDADTLQEDLRYFLDPKNGVWTIVNLQGELEGYCSFGLDGQVPGGDYGAQALDIGMGIRPDLVGQGRGKAYAQAVASYGANHYGVRQLRVTIATFNNRAQQVWKQLGFKPTETFTRIGSEEKFIVMTGDVEMLSPVTVRSLTPADAEAYHSVRLRALHEHPPAFGSVPADEPDLAETVTRLAESDDRCFFGAFQADRLVGIIRLSRYDSHNEKHRAYLAGLFVMPQSRRSGCGRALVQQALSRAANTPGIRRVNLTVVTQQASAIRLYQSFGFQTYGTEPETFSRDGQFYDEHLMTLELNADKIYDAT